MSSCISKYERWSEHKFIHVSCFYDYEIHAQSGSISFVSTCLSYGIKITKIDFVSHRINLCYFYCTIWMAEASKLVSKYSVS